MTDMTGHPPPGATKGDAVAFGSIFAVSFVLFLAIALFALLLTWNWRHWLPVAEGEKSLIHGVKSAVYTFMPYLT
jgi:light-harvesting complex 1 beta chain